MSGDIGTPRDDPLLREEAGQARFRINTQVFRGLLDDAIAHAAVPGRADAPAPALPWIPMGPRNIGGRIRCLAQDPRNPSTVYAGSGFGGIWKTEDHGDTWAPLDDFRPPNPPGTAPQALPIGAIGVAPSDPRVLYVGTGEPVVLTASPDYHYPGSGLYRSADAGATFDRIAPVDAGPIGARRYERILVDPWEPERCWIACTTGLWRREPGTPPTFTQELITGGPPPTAAASQDASDVVIDFGDTTAAAPPAHFTVYVALRGRGLFRSRFTRAGAAAGPWQSLTDGLPTGGYHRVKLALCRSSPRILYAVFGSTDQSASVVYRSGDGGEHWEDTAPRPGDDSKQAWYDLVLEVHPRRPEIVYMGTVDMFRTLNAGASWEKVLDWNRYNLGERAHHADQHAVLFDALEPATVWVGNDGGISMSPDLGRNWRKRSHGILACQFYDIAVHPVFPFVTAGGLQDNGTWVGFGGGTWYYLFGGDGGAVGMDPANLQRYLVTWQGPGSPHLHGVERCTLSSTTAAPAPGEQYASPLPDIPPVPSPPAPTPHTRLRSTRTVLTTGFLAGHLAPFTGIVESHPSRSNHSLVGRTGAGYLTTNWSSFTPLATGAFTPAGAQVGALAYAPSTPDTDWWLGTSAGEVFFTTGGAAAGPWNAVAPAGAAGRWISGIAVHPTNPAIVALGVAASPGRVYLSGDRGTTWLEISGRSPGLPAPAADQLGPSPVTSVAFDPASPAAPGAGQTLFVGSLAGVYVIRNAVAPTAGAAAPPAPVWRTFNDGLPLLLVYDLTALSVRDAGGNVVRTVLRCATLGRGIYECDLGGTPAVQLYIRRRVIDDGLGYTDPAILALASDPRLTPATAMPLDRAIDMRVDAPPFSFFQERLDGVEFDEELRPDEPVAGEGNIVRVQIHSRGSQRVDGVEVHLYHADAPGSPAVIPPLQAGFWGAFPGAPPAGAWRRAAPPAAVDRLGPAQPAVARLEWTPPADVGARVALLAVCSHPGDALPAATLPLVVDPADPAGLVATERRAAVHVTAVQPFRGDVYVRDGPDDDGIPGAVAWGGRSPDIVVVSAPEADPDTAFPDPTDTRDADRVRGGALKHIYVRVHNRRNVIVSAQVEVYYIPLSTLDRPATWEKLGATVEARDIPPRGWRFAGAVAWNAPPDPDPAQPYRVALLAALVRGVQDPPPDPAGIADVIGFWRFFVGGERGNNAALRALRYEP